MKMFRTWGAALAAFALGGGFGATAQADSWKTTNPDGSTTETTVKSGNEPARDYKSPDSLPRYSREGGAPIGAPNFFNPRTRPGSNTTPIINSQITVGTTYPYYPGYYYPYPQLPYSGPIGSGRGFQNPAWINVFPLGGGGVPGGYYPPPAYPYPNPYPYGYPGAAAVPTFPTYGYPGYGSQFIPGQVWVGGGNGSYYNQYHSRGNGISVGRGGVRLNAGNTTTTNRGSYSTWP